jgi:hypothetical protein
MEARRAQKPARRGTAIWKDRVMLRLLKLSIAIAVMVAAVAFREPLLRAFGQTLVINEEVALSDVVVVPEWTQAAGALEAADLVHQGLASRVVVLVDGRDEAEIELVRRGVLSANQVSWLVDLLRQLKVEHVESLTDSGNGTEAESRALPEWCDRNHLRAVIIVSLPDHSRRLRRLLQRSMKGHKTRVIVHTARFSSFDPDNWWRTRAGIRIQLQESEKLLLDLLLHPFS